AFLLQYPATLDESFLRKMVAHHFRHEPYHITSEAANVVTLIVNTSSSRIDFKALSTERFSGIRGTPEDVRDAGDAVHVFQDFFPDLNEGLHGFDDFLEWQEGYAAFDATLLLGHCPVVDGNEFVFDGLVHEASESPIGGVIGAGNFASF